MENPIRELCDITQRPHDVISMSYSPCSPPAKSFAVRMVLSIADACDISICQRNRNVTTENTDFAIPIQDIELSPTEVGHLVSLIEQVILHVLILNHLFIPRKGAQLFHETLGHIHKANYLVVRIYSTHYILGGLNRIRDTQSIVSCSENREITAHFNEIIRCLIENYRINYSITSN